MDRGSSLQAGIDLCISTPNIFLYLLEQCVRRLRIRKHFIASPRVCFTLKSVLHSPFPSNPRRLPEFPLQLNLSAATALILSRHTQLNESLSKRILTQSTLKSLDTTDISTHSAHLTLLYSDYNPPCDVRSLSSLKILSRHSWIHPSIAGKGSNFTRVYANASGRPMA